MQSCFAGEIYVSPKPPALHYIQLRTGSNITKHPNFDLILTLSFFIRKVKINLNLSNGKRECLGMMKFRMYSNMIPAEFLLS